MRIPPGNLLQLLEPGETVLWWEVPNVTALRALSGATVVYLFGALGFLVYMLAQISRQPLTAASFPSAVVQGAVQILQIDSMFRVVFAGLTAYIVYAIYRMIRKTRAAATTLYAITDRRIILFDSYEQLSLATIPYANPVSGPLRGIRFARPSARRRKRRIYGFFAIRDAATAVPLLERFIDPKTDIPVEYDPGRVD